MNLFLITSSYNYYPADGTDDWQFLTASEAQARTAFSRTENDNVYLIRLSSDGTYTTLDCK